MLPRKVLVMKCYPHNFDHLGEMHELREELNHQREDKRKEAVKKVIAAMTVGKDVSDLFTDVLNCIQTNNLELKKLVYLYVINHAKMQPDRAILAVNTFQRVILGYYSMLITNI
jgi:AP-1 complex subunit beta-1